MPNFRLESGFPPEVAVAVVKLVVNNKPLSSDVGRTSARRCRNDLRTCTLLILLSIGFCCVEPAYGWRKSPRCNMTTEFECKTGHCIPVDQVCNRHRDCADASDESDCHCVQSWLPPMHRCRNKKCVDDFYTCNGKDDCGDGGSDEENCACYGFRCADGTCILSTWRCDGYKDCKDYSDEENCGALLSGDRRHPFLGLIGPIGCLVAALAIRVLLRSHQRRRLLHSNGETAAVAAATALEARNRRARFPEEATVGGGGGGGGVDRLDDSLDAGSHMDRFPGNSPHWMDRVGAGISSSIAQMRIMFTHNSSQAAGLPPPPPYTETTITDHPPAYHRGTAATAADVPSVYLLVIPAGKPPPSYNESMSLPDLVQSTGNANGRDDLSPSTSNHFVPVTTEHPSAIGAYSTTSSAMESSSAAVFFPDSSQPQPLQEQQQQHLHNTGAFPSIPFAIYRSNASPNNDIVEHSVQSSADSEAAAASTSTSANGAAATSSPLHSNDTHNSGVTLLQNPLSHFLHDDGVVGDGRIPELQHEDYAADQLRPESISFEELPPAYEDIFTGSVISYDSPTSYPEDEEEEEEDIEYPPLQSPDSQPLPLPSSP